MDLTAQLDAAGTRQELTVMLDELRFEVRQIFSYRDNSWRRGDWQSARYDELCVEEARLLAELIPT